MSKVDWSKAPEGSTHAGLDRYGCLCWYKLDAQTDPYYHYRSPGDLQWSKNHGSPCAKVLIEKPSTITSDQAEVGCKEYTGGSVSYYTVDVRKPTNPESEPYQAECNDLIEALNMNYAEGNAFKAIWRRCAARMGKSKVGYKDGLYDAEKVEFFGKRMVEQERIK